MVSLDARRLHRWSNGSPPPKPWEDALRRLVALKREGKGVIARVHHAPAREEVYALVLNSGVDLIGTESLERSARVLEGVGRTGSPRTSEPSKGSPRFSR